jgi:hypothetical protein
MQITKLDREIQDKESELDQMKRSGTGRDDGGKRVSFADRDGGKSGKSEQSDREGTKDRDLRDTDKDHGKDGNRDDRDRDGDQKKTDKKDADRMEKGGGKGEARLGREEPRPRERRDRSEDIDASPLENLEARAAAVCAHLLSVIDTVDRDDLEGIHTLAEDIFHYYQIRLDRLESRLAAARRANKLTEKELVDGPPVRASLNYCKDFVASNTQKDDQGTISSVYYFFPFRLHYN